MNIQALIFHPARPESLCRIHFGINSEQAVGALQKAGDMHLRILSVKLIFNVLP
jgi:hypothetical protein